MAIVAKLDAAERLIVAGILMSERGDDALATHVIAASALNMLRELIKNGGDDYAAWVLQQGLWHAASAKLKGTPLSLPTTTEIDQLIDDVAAGIDKGAIKQATDLKITLTPEQLRKQLDYVVKPYNFLKHADRDPLATLDESDVDAVGTIIHALTAYSILCPGKALPDEIAPFLAKHDLMPDQSSPGAI